MTVLRYFATVPILKLHDFINKEEELREVVDYDTGELIHVFGERDNEYKGLTLLYEKRRIKKVAVWGDKK